MNYSVFEKSTLFSGVPAAELRTVLEEAPHHIQCYDKGEIIFHLMVPAARIGIIMEGRVEAQKRFPPVPAQGIKTTGAAGNHLLYAPDH